MTSPPRPEFTQGSDSPFVDPGPVGRDVVGCTAQTLTKLRERGERSSPVRHSGRMVEEPWGLECACVHDDRVVRVRNAIDGHTEWRFPFGSQNEEDRNRGAAAAAPAGRGRPTGPPRGGRGAWIDLEVVGGSKPLRAQTNIYCPAINPVPACSGAVAPESTAAFRLGLGPLWRARVLQNLTLHLTITVSHSSVDLLAAVEQDYSASVSVTALDGRPSPEVVADDLKRLVHDHDVKAECCGRTLVGGGGAALQFQASMPLCDPKLFQPLAQEEQGSRAPEPAVTVVFAPWALGNHGFATAPPPGGCGVGSGKGEPVHVALQACVRSSTCHVVLPSRLTPRGALSVAAPAWSGLRRVYRGALGEHVHFALPLPPRRSFYRICVVPADQRLHGNGPQPKAGAVGRRWWPSLYLSHTRPRPTAKRHHWRAHCTQEADDGAVGVVVDGRRWQDFSPRICFFSVLGATDRHSTNMRAVETQLDASQGVFHGVSTAVPSIAHGIDEFPKGLLLSSARQRRERETEGDGTWFEFEVLVQEIAESEKWGGRWEPCARVWNSIFHGVGMDGMALSNHDRNADKRFRALGGLAYGEVLLMPFLHLLKVTTGLLAAVRPGPPPLRSAEGAFYDLGSGTGVCVVAAAMAGVGFNRGVGIELLPSLHSAALRAQAAYRVHQHGDWVDVEFLCDDIGAIAWEADARLVFAHNLAFPGELQDLIAAKAKRLGVGCGLLVARELAAMDAEVEAGNFECHDGPELECDNTYGALTFKLYIRRR